MASHLHRAPSLPQICPLHLQISKKFPNPELAALIKKQGELIWGSSGAILGERDLD